MENILQNLILVMPEIVLTTAAMILLLHGVFCKVDINVTSYCAVAMMLICCFMVVLLSSEGAIFNHMLIINNFTQYGKLLILLSSICICSCLPTAYRFSSFLTYEIVPLIMLSNVGMFIVISSSHFMSLYMGLELMSLCLYIMAASNRNSLSSSEAGMKYFILGALSSCLYLLGASLLYGITGHLDFAGVRELSDVIQQADYVENVMMLTLFIISLVLIIIAFAFKVSAAPFHMWTPDVYQGSPWIVTAFFASAPKVTALFILARLLYGVFVMNDMHWFQIIMLLSMASMLVGSVGAIMQKSLKRILAYSSIAHVGYALIGLLVGNEDGVSAFIIYISVYVVMTLGTFACLLALNVSEEDDSIVCLSGIGRSRPILAFILAVMMLSMAGIPPMAGFFAKLHIIYSAIRQEMYMLASVAVLASVIAAYYYLRIIKVMYFEQRQSVASQKLNKITGCVIVAYIAMLINLGYVFTPGSMVSLAQSIAKNIFDI